jgi:Arv1-like family
MTPSESTHRQFGREIKLTTCQSCGQNVDPYVERDALLVAMDCLLLREQACRHVLCNHRISSFINNREMIDENENDNDDRQVKPPNMNATSLSIPQYSVASAMVLGHLLLHESQSTASPSMATSSTNSAPGVLFLTSLVQAFGIRKYPFTDGLRPFPWWIPLIYCTYSFCGNLLFIWGIQWGFTAVVKKHDQDTGQPASWKEHQRQLRSRLSLAVLLPTAFHVNTLMVLMIWENSSMVRQLASLLVLQYQFLMSTVAMQLQWAGEANVAPPGTLDVRWVLAFATGIVVRSVGCGILRWIITETWGTDWSHGNTTMEIPCILGVSGDAVAPLWHLLDSCKFCLF